MKSNFFDRFTIVKCTLFMDEVDVLQTLNTVNKYISKNKFAFNWTRLTHGNMFKPYVWRIEFITSVYTRNKLMRELKIKRVWDYEDIPDNIAGKVYSID